MALTEAQLRALRAEVGDTPGEDDLNDLWAPLQSVPAVALAVLRPRLANGMNAAAAGGFSLSGVLGVQAPSAESLKQLEAQILRLEGEFAAEAGGIDGTGVGGGSRLRRYDRVR